MAHFVWRRSRDEHREESLVTPPVVTIACLTKPHLISFTFSLLVVKAALHLPFSFLSKLVLLKPKKEKCLGATVINTAFFNEVMEITKTVKTLNLAK